MSFSLSATGMDRPSTIILCSVVPEIGFKVIRVFSVSATNSGSFSVSENRFYWRLGLSIKLFVQNKSKRGWDRGTQPKLVSRKMEQIEDGRQRRIDIFSQAGYFLRPGVWRS